MSVLEGAGAILDTARLSWLAQRHGDSNRAPVVRCPPHPSIATVQQRRLFWGVATLSQSVTPRSSPPTSTRPGSALHAALTCTPRSAWSASSSSSTPCSATSLSGKDREAESIAHHDEAIARAEAHVLPLPHILALELAAQSAA